MGVRLCCAHDVVGAAAPVATEVGRGTEVEGALAEEVAVPVNTFSAGSVGSVGG